MFISLKNTDSFNIWSVGFRKLMVKKTVMFTRRLFTKTIQERDRSGTKDIERENNKNPFILSLYETLISRLTVDLLQ